MSIRQEWLDTMLQITSPVLDNLSEGRLKSSMPLEFHPERAKYAPLEAFGRSMFGIAPWLDADPSAMNEKERNLQKIWQEKARLCIDRATAPDSPDFMLFDRGDQPLVDIAFLAHALLRAPNTLCKQLDARVKRQLADALRSSRKIPAYQSNWIFFSAMVEAGLFLLNEPYDIMRVLNALRTFQFWYIGDGLYGDGPVYHQDYYNSFVIQPMYVDIVNLMKGEHPEIEQMHDSVCRRASRYASILERMIAPDGSYPIIGRSICYRFGAFQMLSQAALEHILEPHLSPAAVRSALTAVIHRVMSAPDTFDNQGWLRPGVYGYQPELAESYISVGSLYLCSAVFLPLGLSPKDPFWADPDEDWTSKKVFSGAHIVIDHAID